MLVTECNIAMDMECLAVFMAFDSFSIARFDYRRVDVVLVHHLVDFQTERPGDNPPGSGRFRW